MGYKMVVIAEKPSVGMTLGSFFKIKEKKHGYLICENDIIVSWCVGHIIELKSAEEYDAKYKKWELENFPFLPEFQYKVKDSVKDQFKILEQLINRNDVDSVVHACDNDREGHLILELFLNYVNNKKTVKRLLVNEWTPDEIRRGFSSLKDESEMINMKKAGYTRMCLDWIFGINLTSVVTVNLSEGKLLNIGRNILAVTKLVYDREMAIKNFKPVPYYELKATFNSPNGTYNGYYIDSDKNMSFDDRSSLEKVIECINGKSGIITDKTVKTSKAGPKKLFNLTGLQGYITSKYSGWGTDRVLKACQELYEGKLISYPRTVSTHLDESLVPRMEKVLASLKDGFEYSDLLKFHQEKSVFDSSKVDSHSAITPTYITTPGNDLTEDQKIVYKEIKNRFLSQFMPDAIYENTEIITSVENETFRTRGKVLKSPGWLLLYQNEKIEDHDEDPLLPNVNKSDVCDISNLFIEDKKTTAPPHYTQETLLKSMETCGNNTEDKNLTEEEQNKLTEMLLKGFSIGTPATAGPTIEKLLSVGYIEKKGKSIYLTMLGKKIIEVLPFKNLMDVKFTGMLEKKLKDIENGTFSSEEYMESVKKLIVDAVNKVKSMNTVIAEKEEKESIGKCPECESEIYEGESSYYCSKFRKDDPKSCNFSIWKENKLLAKNGMKKINKAFVKKLLTQERMHLTVNYTNHIFVSLVKDEGKWSLKFEFPSKEESKELREVLGECPGCGKNIYESAAGYFCESLKDNPEKCKFFISKENKLLEKFGVKKVSKSLLKDLLDMKKVTYKINPTAFVYATLENQERWTIKFEFPSKEESKELREIIGKCPETGCSGNVYETQSNYKCDNESCKFALWKKDKFFERYDKKMTKAIAKQLLEKRQVVIPEMVSPNNGKKFEGKIKFIKKDTGYWGYEFLIDSKK